MPADPGPVPGTLSWAALPTDVPTLMRKRIRDPSREDLTNTALPGDGDPVRTVRSQREGDPLDMDRDALVVLPEAAPGATPVLPVTRSGAFRALRAPMFRRYFFGQIASASGTFLQQTAIGWLVLELIGSATALGLVLAVGGLRSLLLGPFGGTLADRVDNRRLLLVTQSLFGLLAATLWIIAATGHLTVVLIVAVNIAAGFVHTAGQHPRRVAQRSARPPPPSCGVTCRIIWRVLFTQSGGMLDRPFEHRSPPGRSDLQ